MSLRDPSLHCDVQSMEQHIITTAEAARLLRVSPRTIKRWIRDGTVPSIKVGGRRLVLIKEIIDSARPGKEEDGHEA